MGSPQIKGTDLYRALIVLYTVFYLVIKPCFEDRFSVFVEEAGDFDSECLSDTCIHNQPVMFCN